MAVISFKSKGNFDRTFMFLQKASQITKSSVFDDYGKKGVRLLSEATPKDTGLTASSWSYRVSYSGQGVKLEFLNSNIQNGVPIAIILQYGHGTGWGGYVQGRDYINPVVQPLFDDLTNDLWREVNQ